MKIKFVIAIFTLTAAGLFSGCGVLSRLAGNSSASGGNYSALLSKKEELAAFQPTGTPSGKEMPKIKGKVAIVKKESGGQAELDRFNWEGKFSDAPVGGESSRFYPPEVYAKTLDEIETLIKIECREHKGSAFYTANRESSESQSQNYTKTICDVSVIDYKSKTLLAKVQKGDESAPAVIKLGEGGGGSYYEVFKEIADYLKGIPLELLPRTKPTPGGETVAAADIIKSYKKSKESVGTYQDKELTVTGWGSLSRTYNSILLYGTEKAQGADSITCKIAPNDMADFAEIKEYENHKFTVVGKFDARYTLKLEQCRLINAEKVISK